MTGGTGGATGGTGAGMTGGTGAGMTGGTGAGMTGGTGAGVTGGTGGVSGGTGGVTGGTGGVTGGTGGVTGGTGGVTGGTGGGGTTGCTFTINPSQGEIATVTDVDWSVAEGTPSEAHIEFGPTTSYGMTAPVDLSEPNYRTMLLGMKPSSQYHFQVHATVNGSECVSDDQTVSTGQLQNASRPQITVDNASALQGGFILNGIYQTGPSWIMDADGDYVWVYNIGEVTRTRMSYDGKYMWMCKGNVPQGQAKMVRIRMDGSDPQDFSGEFANLNHDFTILPDGRIAFIAYGSGCDDVKIRTPDGNVTTIYNVGAVAGGTPCHANSIHYFDGDQTLTVSDTDHNHYIKLDLQGNVQWVLGGSIDNNFSGDGANWTAEHGHHVLAADRLLIYNNGAMGSNSLAIEIQLDLSSWTATRVWTYDGGISSMVMGDVQRLDNGNTLVTYSQAGVIHEVNASGQRLRELSWSLGGAVGYSMHRMSLYGPPPK